MSEFENIESEKVRIAAAKFEAVGPLGVTAKDHEAIGSTPPDELKNNPGKTRSELMTEEQIFQWLTEHQTHVKEFLKEKYKDNSFAQSALSQFKKEFRSSIEYLRSIDKLPAGFK